MLLTTNLFIDCEWSEDKRLISMALVVGNGYPSFYCAVDCESPGEWQIDNVMPVLNTEQVDFGVFQSRLESYLILWQKINIIADWPEDIAMFCNCLITGPGERIETPPLTMEIARIDSDSKIPHNALEDALAFMAEYRKINNRQQY